MITTINEFKKLNESFVSGIIDPKLCQIREDLEINEDHRKISDVTNINGDNSTNFYFSFKYENKLYELRSIDFNIYLIDGAEKTSIENTENLLDLLLIKHM